MSELTFEQIIREAHRLLGEVEEVLRRAWRGEGPTEEQVDTLDDVRGQLAVTKVALERMGRGRVGDVQEAPPISLQRPIVKAPAPPAPPERPENAGPSTKRARRGGSR